MKKILVPIIVIMLLILTTLPALAHSPTVTNTDVTITEVTVTGERDDGQIYDGDTITVSGSITATSEASINKFLSVAHTEVDTSYQIEDNVGRVIASGSLEDSDTDMGLFSADSETSVTLSWTQTLRASVNSIFIDQDGSALAVALGFFGFSCSETEQSTLTELRYSNEPHSKWDDSTDRFQLETQTASSITGYKLSGDALRDGIDQSSGSLRVVIPAGTVISTNTFSIKYSPTYGFKFQPNDVTFSNPVNVYWNGELILTFTEIDNGNAS